jgi:hypothetical protein
LERHVLYSGIDQHQRTSVITTLTAEGEQVAQVTLPNQRSILSQYFHQFAGPHQAVVEATGRWYWLRDLLEPAGIDLRLAHAKLLKAIAYAKVKTDAVDSVTLAQLLRVGLIPHAHMISDALRGPRDVLRTRLQLVERRTRCENSIGGLLAKFTVEQVPQLPPLYQVQARAHAAQLAVLETQIHELEQPCKGTYSRPPPSNGCSGSPGSVGYWPSPSTSRSMTSSGFPRCSTSGRTVAWSQAPRTRRGSGGTG